MSLSRHEAQVEALYTRDVGKVYAYKERHQEKPYNTWGFWTAETKTYDEAIETMLRELLARAEIPRDARVLDVGCGCGVSSLDLHRATGAEVVGIDLTQASVDYGQRLIAKARAEDRVRLLRMSATALEFPPRSFERAVAIDCACHFDSREAFLTQAARVLVPGGRLVLLDLVQGRRRRGPAARWLERLMLALWKIPAANRYDAEGLRLRLERNGFGEIVIEDVTERMLPHAIAYMRRPQFRREYRKDFGWFGDWMFQRVLWAMEKVQQWNVAEFVLVTATTAQAPAGA